MTTVKNAMTQEAQEAEQVLTTVRALSEGRARRCPRNREAWLRVTRRRRLGVEGRVEQMMAER